jgi:hypothetical protein
MIYFLDFSQTLKIPFKTFKIDIKKSSINFHFHKMSSQQHTKKIHSNFILNFQSINSQNKNKNKKNPASLLASPQHNQKNENHPQSLAVRINTCSASFIPVKRAEKNLRKKTHETFSLFVDVL